MSWRRRVAAALVAAGMLSLGGGFYLPAKAALAQVLLRRAWVATGNHPVRPWPWARTWPVARLAVPALGIERIVLAGDEGAALAFAPGHVDGTAAPGEAGNIVLAGHRDTVFAFLGELALGDELRLETADGALSSYIVTSTTVVNETESTVLDPTAEPTLTLVTCYPLDGTRPGGPLRYVVRAAATGGDIGARGEPRSQDRIAAFSRRSPAVEFFRAALPAHPRAAERNHRGVHRLGCLQPPEVRKPGAVFAGGYLCRWPLPSQPRFRKTERIPTTTINIAPSRMK